MTEEIQLVEQLVRGSKSAFKKIYDKYSGPIYKNIRQLVFPREEAEDLMQDVFTTLWLKRGSIHPKSGVGNWLFVVSYNKSISHLKKRLREKIDYATQQRDAVTHLNDSHIDEQQYSDQVSALEKAIKQLPPHKQKVIRAYYFEHKDCATIAGELNLEESSVRFYLKQARASIKQSVYMHGSYAGSTAVLLLALYIH